jgi:GINS complex subunit 2
LYFYFFHQATVGPFQPQQPVEVPLWLALQLRKEKKCGIISPEWLDADSLAQKEVEEKEDEKTFTKMPYHYSEIASMLLETAQSDVKESRKIRTLLADISDIRTGKIKAGLKEIKGKVDYMKLNNISSIELYGIRNFTVKTLNTFKKLSNATSYQAEDFASQSQAPSFEASQSQSQAS